MYLKKSTACHGVMEQDVFLCTDPSFCYVLINFGGLRVICTLFTRILLAVALGLGNELTVVDGHGRRAEEEAYAQGCSMHGPGRTPPASVAAAASRGVRSDGWNEVAPAVC